MKYTIIIWLILLTACSNLNASEPRHDEYSILLSSLLNINEDKYTYIDSKGKNSPIHLKNLKS